MVEFKPGLLARATLCDPLCEPSAGDALVSEQRRSKGELEDLGS